MENRKTSKKAINVINLCLVCTMITVLAISVVVFIGSPNLISVAVGCAFGVFFTAALAIFNTINFIIEAIRTFNKKDDTAPNAKELTGGNKVLKIVFVAINALLIYVAILLVATSYSDNSYGIKSVIALVPFAIFNTIKFIVFGNNAVFAQDYKKPFKIAFIVGNMLLLSAMLIHTIIIVIAHKLDMTIDALPIVIYTFLLSVFNGIKFIIDDIKSMRKNEQERKLFWQSKIKKTAVIISAIILCGATALVTVFWYTHPTHYSYNDIWIVGKTAEQIEQRYGEYDTEERGEVGYFSKGYLVKNSKYSYSWERKYYMIKFDDEGIAYDTEVVED